MTIRVDIAPGVNGSGAMIDQVITEILFDMDYAAPPSSTSITLIDTNTSARAIISGTGFTYTTFNGVPYLNGGTINSVDYDVKNGGSYQDYVTFSNMTLDASALFNAVVAELTLADLGAIDALFLSEDWDYHGNENPDILLKNATSSSNIPLDLVGNDTFHGGGGKDRFAASAGDDTLFGGAGRDKLWGEANRDKLVGNRGDDMLFGGGGRDELIGNSGRDRLKGDKGNDKMKGGAGADIFDFTGNNQGRDRILDWQDGRDKIDGVTFGEITVSTVGANTELVHDDGTIVFVGQHLTFDAGDFI